MDAHAQQVEALGRGIVALPQADGSVYVGWRLLASDPDGVAFNLYRTSGGETIRLNDEPITASTNFVDTSGDLGIENAYYVRPVLNGEEQNASASFALAAEMAPNSPAGRVRIS